MKDSLKGFDLDTDVFLGNNSVFNGEISTSGKLVIGETASVEGNIAAKTAVIAGKVIDSDIWVSDEVQLLSKAVVYGKLRTREIVSEAGAVFKGFFELL